MALQRRDPAPAPGSVACCATRCACGPRAATSPNCRRASTRSRRCCAERGYHVAMKGKWHLSKPVSGEQLERRATRRGSSATTASPNGSRRTPAATRRPRTSAAASAGDERRRGGMRTTPARWRAGSRAPDLPEPFCLIFSLVNPHDVLGYPGSYARAATTPDEFRDLGRAAAADARGGPAREAGRAGALQARHGQLPRAAARPPRRSMDYVNFYAHLHARGRREDRAPARRRSARAEDPSSLRSRTVIVRTSDHGEMGLSHGGLRQKIFNAYEETIRVPLVVSSPRDVRRSRARATRSSSLLDIVPTLLGLAGAAGGARPTSTAAIWAPLLRGEGESRPRRGAVHLRRPSGRRRRCRTAPASRTASAACATPAGSTRSIWIPQAAPGPNTRCMTC